MHLVLIETTSVRGFDIVKHYSDAGIEVSFVADSMEFFRGDPGSELVSYATRVVEVPGLARTANLAADIAGRLGPHPVDGVICRVEDYLSVGARLAADWGLPHENVAATDLLADKDLVRQKLASQGIGTLKWKGVTSVPDGVAAAANIGLPVVVKPAFGGYSVGVSIARTIDEVATALTAVIGTNGRKAVVEEFAFGLNVSAEILVQDGQCHVLGFTEQRPQRPGLTAETGRHFPARFPGMGAAKKFAISALETIELRNSAVHMELVITSTGPELIEINGRVAGHVVTHLIALATGRSVFDDLADLAVGTPLRRPFEPPRTAVLRHLWSESSGTVANIAEPPQLPPEVEWYEVTVKGGDLVAPLHDNWDRIGYLVASGDSASEALGAADRAADALLSTITLRDELAQQQDSVQAGPQMRVAFNPVEFDTGYVLRALGPVTSAVSVECTSEELPPDRTWAIQFVGEWVTSGHIGAPRHPELASEAVTATRTLSIRGSCDDVPPGAHVHVALLNRGTVWSVGVAATLVGGTRFPVDSSSSEVNAAARAIADYSAAHSDAVGILAVSFCDSTTLLGVELSQNLIACIDATMQQSLLTILAQLTVGLPATAPMPNGLTAEHRSIEISESISTEQGVDLRDLFDDPHVAQIWRAAKSIHYVATAPCATDATARADAAEAAYRSRAGSRTHVLVLDRSTPSALLATSPTTPFVGAEVNLSVITGPSPIETSAIPAFDFLAQTDVFDDVRVDALADALHSLQSIDAIVAIPERLLATAARLRDRFNLAGDRPAFINGFRDKVKMKEIARRAGIRHADGFIVTTERELHSALAHWERIVVKPRASYGSRGVDVLANSRAISDWFATKWVPLEYLCENFVGGQMCSIDALVVEGRRIWDASSYSQATVTFTAATSVSCQSIADPAWLRAAEQLLDDVVAAWQVRRAVLHIEAFWDGTALTFCELAARPGGAGVVDGFRASRGVDLDLSKALLDVGRTPRWLGAEPIAKYAGWTLIYGPAGVLVRVDDEAVASNALARRALVEVGSPVAPASFAGNGVAIYVFADDDPARLSDVLRRAETSIRVEVDQ